MNQLNLFKPDTQVTPYPCERLPCLSIRQPWAHFILHAGKDIENRSWPTKYRGRILIHAAKSMTTAERSDALSFAQLVCGVDYEVCGRGWPRGGIVGSVEIVDCVERSSSPWFVGKYGFLLRNPQVHQFYPLKGRLGFFYPKEQP